MVRVYLAFHRADRALAKQVAEQLQADGHRVFARSRKTTAEEAAKRLDRADLYLWIASNQSLESASLRRELQRRQTNGGRAAVLALVEPDALPELDAETIDMRDTKDGLVSLKWLLASVEPNILLADDTISTRPTPGRNGRALPLAVGAFLVLMVLVFFLLRSGGDDNGDSASNVALAEETPELTPEVTATVVPTLTPTLTPTSTITPTNEPTVTLEPTMTPVRDDDAELDAYQLVSDVAVETVPMVVQFSVMALSDDGQAVLIEADEMRTSWDFDGDGTIDDDTAREPFFVYEQPGIYEAQVMIEAGGFYATRSQVIVVYPESGPDETLNPTFGVGTGEGFAPLTVDFRNTSDDAPGAIFAWDTDGDGRYDILGADEVTATFETPGQFPVSLVMAVDGRVSDPVSSMISVLGDTQATPAVDDLPQQEPGTLQADFVVDVLSGEVPLTVNYLNRSSDAAVRFTWDFNGDGTIDLEGDGPQTFTFNEPGTFTTTLIAYDAAGASSVATQAIDVLVADFEGSSAGPSEYIARIAASPRQGEAPLSVTFVNQSEGDIRRYEWDFNGDGVIDSRDQIPPPFTFTAPGTYVATLTAIGRDDTRKSSQVNVTVTGPDAAPVRPASQADFRASVTTGTTPLTVRLTNTSAGRDNLYQWDTNGDGRVDSSATDPPPVTFTAPGTYTITLTVLGFDATGQPNSTRAEQVIVVNAP